MRDINVKDIANKTIYKDNFYKQIKSILGDSKKFIKSNKLRRKSIDTKLKELSLLSELTNIFREDFDCNVNEFITEKKIFIEILDRESKREIIRKDSDILINNLKRSVGIVIKYAYDNGYIINNCEIDFILSKLNFEKLFYLITSSSLSSLIYLSHEDDNLNIEENEIDRFKLTRTLMNNLLLYIMIVILEDNPQASSIIILLYQNIPNILHDKSSNRCFIKTSYQLIMIYCYSCNIKSRSITFRSKNNEIKTLVLLSLPEKIVNYNINSTHIPEIIQPEIEYNTIEDELNFSKKVKNGVSHIEMGTTTKSALKISQNKKFKINIEALKLFKYLDELSYEDVKHLDCLPFTPLNYLFHLEGEIKEMEDKLSKPLISKIINIFDEFKRERKNFSNIEIEILDRLSISEDLFHTYKRLYSVRKELHKRMRLRVLHNTIMEFGEIFNGFPIFFKNSYDYRLRMYPWNFMFNRTSGIYKYLLIDEPSSVNNEGLKTMMRAYFKDNLEKLEELEKIGYQNKEKLLEWFEPNPIKEDFKKSSFLYHSLLGIEIKKLRYNNFKSGFLIEIDQKTSGAVILAIVFGDKKLAEETNLLSGNDNKDANVFIMEKSYEWFKDKLSKESLQTLSSARELHKFLFMCFIYNETFYGRMKRVSQFINCSDDVKIIAEEYPYFINTIFPSLSYKRELFNKIIKSYIEKSNKPIELETLDGSLISWYIFNKKSEGNVKLKVTDPISNNKISYHYIPLTNQEMNIRKTIQGMLPSLIHSIDAAIMRLIIINVFKEKNYIINHLHDSIQFHPNYERTIRSSIIKVYTNPVMNNILVTKVFSKLLNNLLPEDKIKLNFMIEDLLKEFNELDINSENFNVEGMFPYE